MLKTKWFRCLILFGVLLLLFVSAGCNTPQTPTPTEPPQTPPATPPAEPAPHLDLIDSIVRYLELEDWAIDPIIFNFAERIDCILEGANAFYVTFNPDDYYYVCGYLPPDSVHFLEAGRYCCVNSYTWVWFDNEADILEFYNGEQLVVALQVNRADSCKELLDRVSADYTAEHFQLYQTEFLDGVNVSPAIAFDQAFIFLPDLDQTDLYCCQDIYCFYSFSFSCVELDGEAYVTQMTYSEKNGSGSYTNLERDFEGYYDDLMEIMIVDRYSNTSESGWFRTFGLFELNEFVSFLGNEIGKK